MLCRRGGLTEKTIPASRVAPEVFVTSRAALSRAARRVQDVFPAGRYSGSGQPIKHPWEAGQPESGKACRDGSWSTGTEQVLARAAHRHGGVHSCGAPATAQSAAALADA